MLKSPALLSTRNVMNLIDKVVAQLATYTPKSIEADLPDAGILVPIVKNAGNPQVILTRRAQHLSTHKGQVAFPGGKYDEEDGTVLQTALRESHEEIDLPANEVTIVGQLSQVISLHGIRVTPYVGLVDESVPLTPNLDELDSIFKVPIEFLKTAEPTRRDRMTYKGMALSVPSYDYLHEGETYEIWGLSAIVLVELLNVGFGSNITIFDEVP